MIRACMSAGEVFFAENRNTNSKEINAMKKGPENKTKETKEQALEPRSARTLKELIAKNETWLMNRILQYAKTRGYTKYSSPLQEAWRLSIAGLSESLISALRNRKTSFELKPDEDYMKDPAASFGIMEAQKHRQRGISLEMFLGLMKYYRKSYKDLVRQSNLNSGHKTRRLNKIERFFDRVEIGFCKEWAALSEGEKLQGVLQMAGAICHELTQPMQAISGNAELLLMTMSKNDTKSKKVQNILSQMGRMNNITRKLQVMTRCETKPYVLGTKIIDIYRSCN